MTWKDNPSQKSFGKNKEILNLNFSVINSHFNKSKWKTRECTCVLLKTKKGKILEKSMFWFDVSPFSIHDTLRLNLFPLMLGNLTLICFEYLNAYKNKVYDIIDKSTNLTLQIYDYFRHSCNFNNFTSWNQSWYWPRKYCHLELSSWRLPCPENLLERKRWEWESCWWCWHIQH